MSCGNEAMLARLILCVEHKARAMLPEYVICEMAEIIERVTGQPCAPGGAIELASRYAEGLILPGVGEVKEWPKEASTNGDCSCNRSGISEGPWL